MPSWTIEEVEKAIFSIASVKAWGIHGFNAFFFKVWSIVGSGIS